MPPFNSQKITSFHVKNDPGQRNPFFLKKYGRIKQKKEEKSPEAKTGPKNQTHVVCGLWPSIA